MSSEDHANPYRPGTDLEASPDQQRRSVSIVRSVGIGLRSVGIYIGSFLVLMFFVAPLIAPTDVAPEGAPPVPEYLRIIQVVVCYGLPAWFVYLDRKAAAVERCREGTKRESVKG